MANSAHSSRRWIAASTIGDLFDQSAAAVSHEAVIFPGERATYPEVAERSDAFARSLMSLGVGLQDKVGVLLPSNLDHIVALIGIAKAGAVAVPINGRFKKAELRHVVRASDMKVLVANAGGGALLDQEPLVSEAVTGLDALKSAGRSPEAPQLEYVVSMGPETREGWTSRAAFDDHARNVEQDRLRARGQCVRARDAAILMFTSGTTAAPKAAILSHEAVSRQAANLADTRFLIRSDDRVWNAMPLFHIGGMAFGFACFARGATYVHAGFFDPAVALRQLIDEKCTVALPAFETIWLAIVNLPEFRASDLDNLRLILNLGTPERLHSLQKILPKAITISAFGATEGCSFLTAGKPSDSVDVRLDTLGSPMDGTEVRIIDLETGVDVRPGVVGEILYRGPTVFDGYYGEPELTARVIDRQGWFHSGDLGNVDGEGRLRYHGRQKDMMKVGGENVAALEVEEYLIRHPAILLAQVVAAPDAYYGEVPAAYVQLKRSANATAEEIIDFCLGEIATFKVPRYVRFVDEWPMSGTKIRKVDLRVQIAEELARGGISAAPKLRSRAAAQ